MQKKIARALALICALTTAACQPGDSSRNDANEAMLNSEGGEETTAEMSDIEKRLAKYTTVRLTSDLSVLSEGQRQMIPLLIEAAQAMDDGFWRQAYGDKDALLASIEDPEARRYAEINYGPWDRLAGNESFIEGVGQKPPGAAFYPKDMAKQELEDA